MTSILYVGRSSGTSGQRLAALRRLGHQVQQVDPYAALPTGRLAHAWTYKTGNLGLDGRVHSHIATALGDARFDVALVDNGELISLRSIATLRRAARRIAVFNQDNPFSARDGNRWRLFRKALPDYDLYITPRQSNVVEGQRAGARQILRVWFSADEIAHQPIALTAQDQARFACDVAFVGTWMPERGPLMRDLIERGVPLRIYGPRWQKAPEFPQIAPFVHQGELKGADYVKAILAARISLALLSKGNRDLHTTRSLEIPAIGSLLCGERTSEHQALYEEGTEAVFWDDAAECATLCAALLADEPRRSAMAQAGHSRALANRHFNERWLSEMIATTMATPER
ncbi:glycosyltransferase [Sphingobium sp. H39-3-25]|uniref:CgeB family protein n=1 Tax=Sphingobium arseniciresistens TaxID=3030834 RepID=UPI0023B91A03|nr:glycosyltransferase [Sphingobium arseniciresistens]